MGRWTAVQRKVRNMKILTIAAGAMLLVGAPALGNHHGEKGKTVVETAMASPQHETLVAAVTAADLAATLGSEGPFTVFAPTDAAFAALPAETVATLLKPENKAKLQAVLTYHVVPGKVKAADLVALIEANGGQARLKTVAGGELLARIDDGKVVLTDAAGGTATVIAADISASNGVIHATDAVSLPG
jgi:uncharacterized surface protein with fasciclin (FAS1) repeats